jgi:arginine utilization regulatory protein
MSFSIQTIEKLLDKIEEGIIILNENFKIIYFNNFAKKTLDLQKNYNLNFKKMFPDVNLNSNINIISNNNRTLKIKWEKELINKENAYVGLLKDITDYENIKIKLLHMEEILDNVSEGIMATNKEGKITIFNKTIENLEDLSRKKVLSKNILDIYHVTPKTSEIYTVLKTKKPLLGINRKHYTKERKEINLVSDCYPLYRGDKIVGAYAICRNVTNMRKLLNETINLQKRIDSNNENNIQKSSVRYKFDDIIGESKLLKKAVIEAKKAAQHNSSVLIVGDTGTGKEIFVQSIHEESLVREKPFVPINCAAIPESLLESLLFGTVKGTFTGATDSTGLFQQAGNGTLFLDEINSMGMYLQSKILRVLQEKRVRKVGGTNEIPVKCRIISTVNKDPIECIKEETLRRDLYHRLAVFTIYIPPLRERKDDIEPLTKYFINLYNKKYNTSVNSISAELMDIFLKYQWPGNVRELQHLIESALNMVGNEKSINLEHLPSYFYNQFSENKSLFISKSHNLSQILLETEERAIIQALSQYNGNVTQAANSLGIARQNLHYRIRKLGINTNELRE